MLSTLSDSSSIVILEHIERLYKNSECRTPLVVFLTDGDPLPSIRALATQQKLSVWAVVMDSRKSEQNAFDYLDVGLKNGDWVYLRMTKETEQSTLRRIALLLMTISPDPEFYPNREHFRLWISVDEPFDLNDRSTDTPFPAILRKNALIGTVRECDSADMGCSHKSTLRRQHAVEPSQYTIEEVRRKERSARGKGEESESDTEDPIEKLTGMWFHRHADLFHHVSNHRRGNSHTTPQEPEDSLFHAIREGKLEAVQEALQNLIDPEKSSVESTHSASILINELWKEGLTPFMWSLLYNHDDITKYLLSRGADPNVCAQGSGTPPLFMSLNRIEEIEMLLSYNLDLEQTFEGKLFADHPSSSPEIIQYLRKRNLI